MSVVVDYDIDLDFDAEEFNLDQKLLLPQEQQVQEEPQPQPKFTSPCILCHDPTEIQHRVGLMSKVRVTRKATPVSVRSVLENQIAKLLEFQNIPIEEGKWLCTTCFHRISTLYCVCQDLEKRLGMNNKKSYINQKIDEAQNLRKRQEEMDAKCRRLQKPLKIVKGPGIRTNAPPLIRYIKTPQICLRDQLKNPASQRHVFTHVERIVRAECKTLNTKAISVFKTPATKKDMIDDIDLFWNNVLQSLETYAPLTLRLLETIATRPKGRLQAPKDPLEPKKLIPSVGAAFCTLLNTRNQNCSRFQFICSIMLNGISIDRTRKFFNLLKISLSAAQYLRHKEEIGSDHVEISGKGNPHPQWRKQLETNIVRWIGQASTEKEKATRPTPLETAGTVQVQPAKRQRLDQDEEASDADSENDNQDQSDELSSSSTSVGLVDHNYC